jgi:hypothetical protein
VGEVNLPLPPTDPREQADVAGPRLEALAAVVPPRTLRALGDGDRHYEKFDRRVAQMCFGDGDDIEPKAELEVVALHRGSHFLLPGRGRRAPDRGIEVVPDNALLGAYYAAPAPARSSEARSLEHPLVVGKLEKILLTLLRREPFIDDRVL